MTRIPDGLRLLSAAALGLFAGAMLTEGAVLVPYWRSLPAAEFFTWYAANDQRLLGFFGPVTAVAVLVAVAAAVASVWQGHPGRWGAVAAAVLAIAALSTFFLYFQQANTGFSTGSTGPERLAAELARWAWWHWLRTGISVTALGAALLSLRPGRA